MPVQDDDKRQAIIDKLDGMDTKLTNIAEYALSSNDMSLDEKLEVLEATLNVRNHTRFLRNRLLQIFLPTNQSPP